MDFSLEQTSLDRWIVSRQPGSLLRPHPENGDSLATFQFSDCVLKFDVRKQLYGNVQACELRRREDLILPVFSQDSCRVVGKQDGLEIDLAGRFLGGNFRVADSNNDRSL
jgi:hypothetical protein